CSRMWEPASGPRCFHRISFVDEIVVSEARDVDTLNRGFRILQAAPQQPPTKSSLCVGGKAHPVCRRGRIRSGSHASHGGDFLPTFHEVGALEKQRPYILSG